MLLQACAPGDSDWVPSPAMIAVPAGQFVMGQEGVTRAEPEHQVSLSRSFLLGRFEVTNAEYRDALQWAWDNGLCAVEFHRVVLPSSHLTINLMDMGDPACEIEFLNGVFLLRQAPDLRAAIAWPGGYDPADHPVTMVTWLGAAVYCDWLSLRLGLPPYYDGNFIQDRNHDPYRANGYRLPTEAEWEHAARYPDGRSWPWGDAEATPELANHLVRGWTTPVGAYPEGRSSLGFSDLSGNVWEWVGDSYEAYDSIEWTDPLGPATSGPHVIRGGYWGNGPELLKCAARVNFGSDSPYPGIGFRICRTAP
ncbi:MAG: SUMF1/EgtB/PvdO family nonheme iron enzyme [Candidatus Delongbacteria bacterium]|nr:SUMF1/EgtB/PvdO family nonheme iron enzyme [Candidatus Delongbacteria bacterium]